MPKVLKKVTNYRFSLKKAQLVTLQESRSNECLHSALEDVY